MEFELSIVIEKPPRDVFTFFRDIYKLPFQNHPVVPVYEKTTPGPVAVGSCFREVVRVPFFNNFQILSEITACEADEYLEYTWKGPGMHGDLSYRLQPAPGGTMLIQKQTFVAHGLLAIFNPISSRMFLHQIKARLNGIKGILEGRAEFGTQA